MSDLGTVPVPADSPQTDKFWPIRKTQNLTVCATPGALIVRPCQRMSVNLDSAGAVPRGAILRSAHAVAVMTLLDGVMSTNGCCTATPSFSYSAQTLTVPYFEVFFFFFFEFQSSFPPTTQRDWPGQLSITAKPGRDLERQSLSPLLSRFPLVKWSVA